MKAKSHLSASSPGSAVGAAEDSQEAGGLFHRPDKPLKPRHAGAVPNRYLVKDDEKGRYLSCLEAPDVKVRVQPGMSVTAGAARKSNEGTIFLDGVAHGPPFLDLEKRIYNLDHHEDCVRQFTLATCEQALVLVNRGLDLREKSWEIFAGEPDLDALLAIWVLLNGMHLQPKDSPLRESVFSLVRLEGVIDSYGLESAQLTGFSGELLTTTSQMLERLREAELASRESGLWESKDPLDYVCSQLQLFDRMVYPRDFFEDFRGIEELAKVELSDHRIAVVCRSDCGIYELEKDLKRLYGKRLGVIALEKAPRIYTLRQVDPFLPVSLEAAYRKLNVLDPAVKAGGAVDRWGGSAEIGGSPRRSGTALGPLEISKALALAYCKPSWVERLKSVAAAGVSSAAPLVLGWLTIVLMTPDPQTASALIDRFRLPFLATALATALIALLVAGRRGRRVYGLQWPDGTRWLWMAPVVVLGALAGGSWLLWWAPFGDRWSLPIDSAGWLVLLGFPLLAELLFRGLAHGAMVHKFSIQHSRGRWFLSWPVAISALLFALWTVPFSPPGMVSAPWPWLVQVLVLVGALVSGVGLGMARERSGSLLAPLALHYLAVATVLVIVG